MTYEKSLNKINTAFPGALSNTDLVSKVKAALDKHSYDGKTLLTTSLCCDEVNRVLEKDFSAVYGDNFSMGGIAGFPFCGLMSFRAMVSHIPEDGSCLVVYGPHVGVDSDGVVGYVDRRGVDATSACCGSGVAALDYVSKVFSGEIQPTCIPADPLDLQHSFVVQKLSDHGERLQKAEEPNVEVPLVLFDCQDEMIKSIVSKGCGGVAGKGLIALLGGIQINTPVGTSDYFLPKVFELRNNKSEVVANLISSLALSKSLPVELPEAKRRKQSPPQEPVDEKMATICANAVEVI